MKPMKMDHVPFQQTELGQEEEEDVGNHEYQYEQLCVCLCVQGRVCVCRQVGHERQVPCRVEERILDSLLEDGGRRNLQAGSCLLGAEVPRVLV